jgi:hypothetical protein
MFRLVNIAHTSSLPAKARRSITGNLKVSSLSAYIANAVPNLPTGLDPASARTSVRKINLSNAPRVQIRKANIYADSQPSFWRGFLTTRFVWCRGRVDDRAGDLSAIAQRAIGRVLTERHAACALIGADQRCYFSWTGCFVATRYVAAARATRQLTCRHEYQFSYPH